VGCGHVKGAKRFGGKCVQAGIFYDVCGGEAADLRPSSQILFIISDEKEVKSIQEIIQDLKN